MVKRIPAPGVIQFFEEHIGRGLAMNAEIDRLNELVANGEFCRLELNSVYTMTRHWRYIRKCALNRDNYTCQMCTAKNIILHVHHKKYSDFGKEQLEDLQTLCIQCHNKISSFDVSKRIKAPVQDALKAQIFEVVNRKFNEDMKWSIY